MSTVDWIKVFKSKIFEKISVKTGWGYIQLEAKIEEAFRETLEEMINQGSGK